MVYSAKCQSEVIDGYPTIHTAVKDLLGSWNEEGPNPFAILLCEEDGTPAATMLASRDGTALVSLADGRQRKFRVRYVLDADGCYVRARVTRVRPAIRVEVPCVARPVTEEEVERHFRMRAATMAHAWPYSPVVDEERWNHVRRPGASRLADRRVVGTGRRFLAVFRSGSDK